MLLFFLLFLSCALCFSGCNKSDDTSNPVTIIQTRLAGTTQSFTLGNSGINIEMSWIPNGVYSMGSENSGPPHQVNIRSGFWLGRTEFTQNQWVGIMRSNPSHFIGDSLPVESVSWIDIHALIDSLNRQSGNVLWRLPSEAEWEYAIRAGSSTNFYWGNDNNLSLINDYAWYSGNSSQSTHIVGRKHSNTWNLFDMAGNIYEWCEDYYHDDYNGAPATESAWLNPITQLRVLRGGSWNDTPGNCFSTSRLASAPVDQGFDFGFRIVRNDN